MSLEPAGIICCFSGDLLPLFAIGLDPDPGCNNGQSRSDKSWLCAPQLYVQGTAFAQGRCFLFPCHVLLTDGSGVRYAVIGDLLELQWTPREPCCWCDHLGTCWRIAECSRPQTSHEGREVMPAAAELRHHRSLLQCTGRHAETTVLTWLHREQSACTTLVYGLPTDVRTRRVAWRSAPVGNGIGRTFAGDPRRPASRQGVPPTLCRTATTGGISDLAAARETSLTRSSAVAASSAVRYAEVCPAGSRMPLGLHSPRIGIPVTALTTQHRWCSRRHYLLRPLWSMDKARQLPRLDQAVLRHAPRPGSGSQAAPAASGYKAGQSAGCLYRNSGPVSVLT